MGFMILAGGLLIVIIAVIVAVVSSVVSAVAADSDESEVQKIPAILYLFHKRSDHYQFTDVEFFV